MIGWLHCVLILTISILNQNITHFGTFKPIIDILHVHFRLYVIIVTNGLIIVNKHKYVHVCLFYI